MSGIKAGRKGFLKPGEKGKREKGEKVRKPEDMVVPGFSGDAEGEMALHASSRFSRHHLH
jgi:hypothetical protein